MLLKLKPVVGVIGWDGMGQCLALWWRHASWMLPDLPLTVLGSSVALMPASQVASVGCWEAVVPPFHTHVASILGPNQAHDRIHVPVNFCLIGMDRAVLSFARC